MEFRVDHAITSADDTATRTDVFDLHDARPDDDATGDGVTVAVMDSGVDPTHPIFADASVRHEDFTGRGTGDEVGHGTAVAGLVALLAPEVDLVSLRIFGDSGRTGMGPISDAYRWLRDHVDEVDVCNVSWGASSTVAGIDDLHRQVREAGVQDVVAAGNTGERGGSPATEPGAYSVGALTPDGQITRFSSYDPRRDDPDVAALGKDLRLARADGTSMGRVLSENWVKASGTSFAAPVAAGLVARYLSTGGTDPASRFERTARDLPDTPEDGEGVLDYGRALAPGGGRHPTASAVVREPFGVELLTLDTDWFDPGEYTAVRVDDRTVRFETPHDG